jgi:hypothetical protein
VQKYLYYGKNYKQYLETNKGENTGKNKHVSSLINKSFLTTEKKEIQKQIRREIETVE